MSDTGDESPAPQQRADQQRALISLSIGDAKLRVEGPEDLVERTIASYLPTLQRLINEHGGDEQAGDDAKPERMPLGMAITADAATDSNGAASKFDTPMERLKHWYTEQIVHPEGKRGFVQDHVLLFTYFTTDVLRRASAATADIRRCFETLDLRVPNIPVMVYNLKAKGQLRPAEQYASYHLTDAGRGYIEDRFSLVRKIH